MGYLSTREPYGGNLEEGLLYWGFEGYVKEGFGNGILFQ